MNSFPDWLFHPTWPLDRKAAEFARAHQLQLTKPLGSLGELEVIAERFAAWQGRPDPRLERIAIRIFAADHGVCTRGVSAFPQEVTGQMIANFLQGGAAINVLARLWKADLGIHNLGTVSQLSRTGTATFPPDASGSPDCHFVDDTIAHGTQDFSALPAMTDDQLARALAAGAAAVPNGPLHLFIGGEMGIGNTTSAAALLSVLLDVSPELTVGPGTGLDPAGLQRKRQVVKQGLALHVDSISRSQSPALAALTCVGGFEIAALVGAYIHCAQRGVGILVDGYISTAAALCAVRIKPQVRDWLLFGHVSAEPAHRLVLDHLDATPLLDLRMRLGEGSGAAVAVPLLQSALALHNGMATFGSAGVAVASEQDVVKEVANLG